MNTEYELFEVVLRRWLESIKTAVEPTKIKTTIIAAKKRTVKSNESSCPSSI